MRNRFASILNTVHAAGQNAVHFRMAVMNKVHSQLLDQFVLPLLAAVLINLAMVGGSRLMVGLGPVMSSTWHHSKAICAS
jgi:hypothetical protein